LVDKTRIRIELAIVFALSLGASSVYSIISLIAKLTAPSGLAGQSTTLNRRLSEIEWLDFSYQFLAVAFGLAPVALVLYLLWEKSQSPFTLLGLNFKDPAKDLGRGLLLFAAIGIPGVGLYLLSRLLGISAQVIPADLAAYWWTVPMLVLAAAKAALLEEVVVVGYLFKRLEHLGLSKLGQVIFGASVRASYHLYQGFGGFIGNFVMGLIFGWLYQRWGRVMPLVVAHFLLDLAAFVGYQLLRGVVSLP
jgi:membrane protease YdiL (CAAX protease family)